MCHYSETLCPAEARSNGAEAERISPLFFSFWCSVCFIIVLFMSSPSLPSGSVSHSPSIISSSCHPLSLSSHFLSFFLLCHLPVSALTKIHALKPQLRLLNTNSSIPCEQRANSLCLRRFPVTQDGWSSVTSGSTLDVMERDIFSSTTCVYFFPPPSFPSGLGDVLVIPLEEETINISTAARASPFASSEPYWT